MQLVKDREDDSVWNYFKPKWTADLVKDGPDEGDPITDTPLQELDAAQLLPECTKCCDVSAIAIS